jgi:hypothetical protein
MNQKFGKRWSVVPGFTEIRDPDAFLRVEPRFRAKGHVDERAEKNISLGLSGFWISGIEEP